MTNDPGTGTVDTAKLEDLSSDIRCIEFAIFNIHLLVNPTHVREYLKLGPCTELDRGLHHRLQKTTSFLNNGNYYRLFSSNGRRNVNDFTTWVWSDYTHWGEETTWTIVFNVEKSSCRVLLCPIIAVWYTSSTGWEKRKD